MKEVESFVATIDPDLHKCEGCGLPLNSVDETIVADVQGFYGERVLYYHLSHAPAWIQFAHRAAMSRWN